MGKGAKAACLVAVTVLAVGTASAQPAVAPDRNDRRAAEALFREGRRATAAHEYAKACAKFGESHALDPSTGTLLNLGDCEEHLGHMLSARNYYQTALAQLGASDPRVRYVRERLDALEDRLPRLTVRLAVTAPRGAAITRDETPVPPTTFGLAIPIDPGEHTVVVSAPRHRERREIVALAEGESRQIVAAAGEPDEEFAVAVPTRAAARPTEPGLFGGSSSAAPPSLARIAGWLVAGVGAAGLATAVVSGVALMRDEATVTDPRHCNAQKQCDQVGLAAAARAKWWLPVNTASWAVAVAGLGAGAYLLISSGAASSRHAVAAVSLLPLVGGAAVDVTSRF